MKSSLIIKEKEVFVEKRNIVQVLLAWMFKQKKVHNWAIKVMGDKIKEVTYMIMDRADRTVLPGMAP